MKLHGWGRFPVIDTVGETFETDRQVQHLLDAPHACIAHGMGKSYGDSALAGHVLLTRRANKFLAFDPGRGTVTCQSGVCLADIIDVMLPRGWFLKTTPGTKLISVGGAIAADVHGKNHHVQGCFSQSVISFRLMLADGRIVTCAADRHPELFRATCGGMGLTGVILDATLQLQAVNSAYIREDVLPCANLEEIVARFDQCQAAPYSVAWIDCLAGGDRLGRSILITGRHDDDGVLVPAPSPKLSVPVECPGFLLNRYSVAAFNQLYYGFNNRRVTNQRTTIDTFFYPLDKIAHWNRMYGAGGFTQYQFVLPRTAGMAGLGAILKKNQPIGPGLFSGGAQIVRPAERQPAVVSHGGLLPGPGLQDPAGPVPPAGCPGPDGDRPRRPYLPGQGCADVCGHL